jgi:hypothetical protein
MKRTFWQQILEYLYIKKKDPEANKGINVKLMHGMNKISIIVFLLAFILILYRLFTK